MGVFLGIDINWERWLEDAWTAGARVLVVAALIYIVMRILQRIIGPAIRRAIAAQMAGQPRIEIDKRADTLSHVVYRTLWGVAIAVGLLTVLPEFGINTGALIASAGIVGIALGFGAQSLVRDVLGGLFILIENQYGKGDVVNLSVPGVNVGGQVEQVNLRRTVLRDLDGAVHTVPNGAFTVASNLTRAVSRVNMLIGVSYEADLDHVFAVINRVGEELAADPQWADDIIDPPKVLGIEEFGDARVLVRILGETQPIRQWDVMRELRRRLKQVFQDEGIEIPYQRWAPAGPDGPRS